MHCICISMTWVGLRRIEWEWVRNRIKQCQQWWLNHSTASIKSNDWVADSITRCCDVQLIQSWRLVADNREIQPTQSQWVDIFIRFAWIDSIRVESFTSLPTNRRKLQVEILKSIFFGCCKLLMVMKIPPFHLAWKPASDRHILAPRNKLKIWPHLTSHDLTLIRN